MSYYDRDVPFQVDSSFSSFFVKGGFGRKAVFQSRLNFRTHRRDGGINS